MAWSFPEIPKGRWQSKGAMLIISSMFAGFVLLGLAKWLLTDRF